MNHDPRTSRGPVPGATTAPGPRRWPALVLLFSFVALMWIVEAADQVLKAALGTPGYDGPLDEYGVRPQEGGGLLGIVFQPFLHGDWAHLANNSIGLLVLGSIIALSGLRPLVKVTLFSWAIGGLVSWLLGLHGTVHIGASGIVFGYIFYVIARGFFSRRFFHIVVGLVIAFYYGVGALAGLSPLQQGISWQGHLGGAVGGLLAAAGLKRRDRTPRAVDAGSVRWTPGPPR